MGMRQGEIKDDSRFLVWMLESQGRVGLEQGWGRGRGHPLSGSCSELEMSTGHPSGEAKWELDLPAYISEGYLKWKGEAVKLHEVIKGSDCRLKSQRSRACALSTPTQRGRDTRGNWPWRRKPGTGGSWSQRRKCFKGGQISGDRRPDLPPRR